MVRSEGSSSWTILPKKNSGFSNPKIRVFLMAVLSGVWYNNNTNRSVAPSQPSLQQL